MSAALGFEGVELALGGRPILRGVDLELRRGEVLGLLGCNGAGKTTLLRLATRVMRPDAGRVALAGRPLGALSRRELARAVAVVPQESHVPFPFSVTEVVLMGRAPHLGLLGLESAADLELARAAMRRVGVELLAERPVTELSGGERQLVMVARALAQEPSVLLLDEPTAFLDQRHRVEIHALVRACASEGRSALVVSHDLALAAATSDRLALLHEGRVAAVGTPEEVLSPELLRAVFGIEAYVLAAPDGTPVVVPRAPSERTAVR